MPEPVHEPTDPQQWAWTLPIMERHARLARERGDVIFAEALEADAADLRRAIKGHADAESQTTPCGGCGAASDAERCIGCMHDFGTPESAWVRRHNPLETQPTHKTTAEREASAALVRALREKARDEDPNNPWRRGSQYWHMHNQMWRRARARRVLTNG